MVVNHHRDDEGEYQEAFISSSKLSLFFSLFFSLSLSLTTTRSIIISLLMLSVIMLLFYEYKK